MRTSEQCVIPADCVFVFCLPLDNATFRSTAANPLSYAAQYGGGWAQYQALFADEANSTLREYELLGVEVRRAATGEAFANLFLERRWKVVLLFSHWHEDSIEFTDRFWNHAELTSLLPADTNCILDLCVCHPTKLVRTVASTRKKVRLCWTDKRRTPLVWFSFYDSLFRVLSKGNYPYFQAFRETATAYIQKFGGPMADLEVACQEI